MINLSDSIHMGIVKAQKDYINWSGVGLGHSAEYLIVTNIAQVISNLKNINEIESIFVEQSTDELKEWVKLENDDELRKGRCDICVERNEEDYVIIEVKNTLTTKGKTYDSIFSDIKRIEVFLKNSSFVNESYVCFLNANYINDKEDTEENKKEISEKISDRLEVFSDGVKSEFPNLKFTFTYKEFLEKTEENKIWGWESVVAKITL